AAHHAERTELSLAPEPVAPPTDHPSPKIKLPRSQRHRRNITANHVLALLQRCLVPTIQYDQALAAGITNFKDDASMRKFRGAVHFDFERPVVPGFNAVAELTSRV